MYTAQEHELIPNYLKHIDSFMQVLCRFGEDTGETVSHIVSDSMILLQETCELRREFELERAANGTNKLGGSSREWPV